MFALVDTVQCFGEEVYSHKSSNEPPSLISPPPSLLQNYEFLVSPASPLNKKTFNHVNDKTKYGKEMQTVSYSIKLGDVSEKNNNPVFGIQ